MPGAVLPLILWPLPLALVTGPVRAPLLMALLVAAVAPVVPSFLAPVAVRWGAFAPLLAEALTPVIALNTFAGRCHLIATLAALTPIEAFSPVVPTRFAVLAPHGLRPG